MIEDDDWAARYMLHLPDIYMVERRSWYNMSSGCA